MAERKLPPLPRGFGSVGPESGATGSAQESTFGNGRDFLADGSGRASLGSEGGSSDPGSVALARILAENDLVSVGDPTNPYVVVARRDDNPFGQGYGRNDVLLYEEGMPVRLDDNPDIQFSMRELGASSPSPWTSWTRAEHVPELRDQKGLLTYYRMKRSDGTIRSALRTLKTPIWAARWFFEPADNTTRAKRQAEFCEENFFRRMNVSWSRFLEDALLCCDYGHMVFEKVFTIEDGKAWVRKLAPRHPMDIERWAYDRNGGPDGVVMYPNDMSNMTNGSTLGYSVPSSTRIVNTNHQTDPYNEAGGIQNGLFIPIRKLVVFALEAEAGDMRGTSVLRSAYKHWYYKEQLYKIDAIQKERHGIGVPVIKLPPTFSKADKELADEMGRNIRTNERAHIVLPPMWEFEFAKLEGQPVDCLPSIAHHKSSIYENVLAPFRDGDSSGKEAYDLFLKSTRYIADTLAEVINRFVVPELINYNWNNTKDYPKLRARWIGEFEDMRTRSFAVRNYIGAGVIVPDDRLEDQIRREMDVPLRDPDSARPQVGADLQEAQMELQAKFMPVISEPATPDNGGTSAPSGGSAGGGGQPGKPGVKGVSGKPGKNGGKGTPGKPKVPGTPGQGSGGASGARVAGPRQTPTPPAGGPQKNGGVDRSGGK